MKIREKQPFFSFLKKKTANVKSQPRQYTQEEMKQLNKTVLGIVNDQFRIIDDYNGRTGMFAPKPPKKPIIGRIFNGIKNLIKRK